MKLFAFDVYIVSPKSTVSPETVLYLPTILTYILFTSKLLIK